MCTRKGFCTSLATVLAITVMIATQVGAVPVTMSSYSVVSQTRVFRGNLSGLGIGTVSGAKITDKGILGGQTGVFSGCDIDFVVLDADGDWSTPGDRILPFETAATSVTAGSIRDPIMSPYQPTVPQHPGALFGLNVDGSVDFATATIGARDAWYNSMSLTVNGSGGFVTLGDNGFLTAAFPNTAIGSGLYIFVGEAGLASQGSTEGMTAWVDITGPIVPAPGAVLLASLGGILVGALRSRKVL